MDATGPSSIDAAEVAKFQAMAAEWWDPAGKFKPLHMLNPVRLDYIAGQIAAEFGRDRRSLRPFEGLRLLDIGCGGGLVAEPMARLGAAVTGADAAAENIEANEEGTVVRIGFGEWQTIQTVQMFLARYARAVADPDHQLD